MENKTRYTLHDENKALIIESESLKKATEDLRKENEWAVEELNKVRMESHLAYQKGFNEGMQKIKGYFNNESFNEAIEEVLKMIETTPNMSMSQIIYFYEEIEKLKK